MWVARYSRVDVIPAEVVARAYLRGLVPGRLASSVFWRLAQRDPRIARVTLDACVDISGKRFRLRLPLASRLNWTLLFSAASRSPDGAMLAEFVRRAETANGILDVGANVGLYTYHAAAVGNAPIVGVEPNEVLARNVNANLEANRLQRARVVCAAATDRPGDVTLHVGLDDLVSSVDGSHVNSYGGVATTRLVPGTTIDLLVQTAQLSPDLVKIDVEGHEVAVLRGAEQTLRRFRPIIFLEVRADSAGAVRSLLSRHGYRGRRFCATGLTDEADLAPGEPLGNFLYEPESR